MPAFHLPQGAAYLVITAITGTIYTLLVWSIRVFIRLKINPPFGWDDIHCTISTIFTLINAALLLSQTGFGLGHHSYAISSRAADTQRILGWLSVICYIQASCFSILSVTFLIVRVTKLTSQARPAYLVAFATGLWCLISTTILLFQCRLPAPWRTRPHSRCIDIYSAWVFITVSRALLEFANVAVATWLIWRLRMPIRPKIIIVALFALRLLVIPPALTRLHYLKVSWRAADWSYARINVQITTQVVMHISTILATIPCVKNFLLVFESGNLHPPTLPQEDNTRRISKRRSTISALRPSPKSTATTPATCPGLLNASRRARSEFDVRQTPTAIRPGPVHTLRLHSWSAPGSLSPADTPPSIGMGGAVGLQTLSTAEHDPEDARVAALERRKSVDSDDSRKRIKRTHSFVVDWRETGARPQVERRQTQRQGSAGTLGSLDEGALVMQKAEV